MFKFSGLILSALISITTSFSAFAATGATGSAATVKPLENKQLPLLVMTTPLRIEAVTSASVCGTTMTPPERRICLGENANEVAVNDTVGQVSRFIIGGGSLCGVDERGIRCWATSGTYEKSIQEILASGDSTRIRFGDSKICLPQNDKTIHCYSAEQGDWVTNENGKNNQYVRKIPPMTVYGPYTDLRDFRVNETGICVLDGERVVCEKDPNQNGKSTVVAPRKTFKGARSLATFYGTICVLSEAGLDCVRGSGLDIRTYHVEGTWVNAVRLFESGYDSICAVDKDEQPMCVMLGERIGDTTDVTPPEFADPSLRVVKFRASGDSRCALIENTSSRERSMLCSSYGKLERVTLGNDAVDFEVGVNGTCVRNAAGLVSCFRSGTYLDSPLPEDGSPSNSAGRCRWNSSRFHCSSLDISTDFSEVKTVLGATPSADGLELPCVIYENRTGLRSVRCFASAERLVSNAPSLQTDNIKIVANYDYACAYGGESTECWGNPLGGIDPPNLSIAQKVLFGNEFGCGKDQFGFICWGRDLDGRALNVPPGLSDLGAVSDFAIGSHHVCAITREGTVSCWGNNGEGQLDVPALTKPSSIAANGKTTCASSDEGVTCWGAREGALLGKGQREPGWASRENGK